MPDLGNLLIISLAVWRVSSLLSHEDGPWEMMESFRYAIGQRYDEYSNAYINRLGTRWYHHALYHFADQLTCLWCCTLWVGLLWTILYALFPVFSTWIAVPFALGAPGVYLHSKGTRYRKLRE